MTSPWLVDDQREYFLPEGVALLADDVDDLSIVVEDVGLTLVVISVVDVTPAVMSVVDVALVVASVVDVSVAGLATVVDSVVEVVVEVVSDIHRVVESVVLDNPSVELLHASVTENNQPTLKTVFVSAKRGLCEVSRGSTRWRGKKIFICKYCWCQDSVHCVHCHSWSNNVDSTPPIQQEEDQLFINC